MYACPHCNQPGLSVSRRMCLGPAIPAACTSCGQKIGAPWIKSLVALLPFGLGILGTAVAPSVVVSALSVLVGAAAMFALFFTFVPLEKR